MDLAYTVYHYKIYDQLYQSESMNRISEIKPISLNTLDKDTYIDKIYLTDLVYKDDYNHSHNSIHLICKIYLYDLTCQKEIADHVFSNYNIDQIHYYYRT